MLILLSGPVGCGKTTLCQKSVRLAHKMGISVAGVLTPALVAEGKKVGIQAVDLRSGETRLLARKDCDWGGVRVGQYMFDGRTMDWMSSLCEDALTRGEALWGKTTVFVDEIGPLELGRGEGLARVIPLLSRPRVGLTVAVVRDTLLEELVARVASAKPQVVALDAGSREIAWAEMRALLL